MGLHGLKGQGVGSITRARRCDRVVDVSCFIRHETDGPKWIRKLLLPLRPRLILNNLRTDPFLLFGPCSIGGETRFCGCMHIIKSKRFRVRFSWAKADYDDTHAIDLDLFTVNPRSRTHTLLLAKLYYGVRRHCIHVTST